MNNINQGKVLSYINQSYFRLDVLRTHGYGKVEDKCYYEHNLNAGGIENVIVTFVKNSLTTSRIVHGHVNSNTFNTCLEKILS